MNKIKVLWASDLVTPTGFSTVAHNIIKYLGEEFDITGVGVNYNGDPHDYKFPVFPAALGTGNVYGDNRVVDLLNTREFDVLFILNDAWVIDRYLRSIKKNVKTKLPKIVVYFPVDAEGHDPEWYSNFDIVTKAVVYTKFGQDVVSGVAENIKTTIIPHGVDTESYYNLGDRWESKTKLFGNRIGDVGDKDNSFIVLNANRNQPRKRLDVTIRGFALFAKDKPEGVKLYMHSGVVDSSVNTGKLTVRYGVDSRLIVTSQKRGVQNVPISRLNLIYNACDVGINTSMGEGWGLCNTEHAATGAAQIVPDHSACRELFRDCGYLVKTSGDFMFDNSMLLGKLVTPEDVANALQILYDNKKYRDSLAEASMKKFTSEEYTWKNISGIWRGLFMDVVNESSSIPN